MKHGIAQVVWCATALVFLASHPAVGKGKQQSGRVAFVGSLTAIDLTNHTITVKGADNSGGDKGAKDVRVFDVSPACHISLPDQPQGAIRDLKAGLSVSVQYSVSVTGCRAIAIEVKSRNKKPDDTKGEIGIGRELTPPSSSSP